MYGTSPYRNILKTPCLILNIIRHRFLWVLMGFLKKNVKQLTKRAVYIKNEKSPCIHFLKIFYKITFHKFKILNEM